MNLPACECGYQKEQAWGYSVFRWSGQKWIDCGKARTPNEALKLVVGYTEILIGCRGCGAELLRTLGALQKYDMCPDTIKGEEAGL